MCFHTRWFDTNKAAFGMPSVTLLFKAGNITTVKASYAHAIVFISAIYPKSLGFFNQKTDFFARES